MTTDHELLSVIESCRDDDEPIIIVCQGPPFCDLVGDDAIQAQINGCTLCDRIHANDALHEETLQ